MKKAHISKKRTRSVRVITTAAMLTAISVVIGMFCKNFLNFGSGLFRITFENFPVILSGILFGPVVGGIVGLVADLVSCLFSSSGAPLPLVSLGAFMVGWVSGLVSHYVIKKQGVLRIVASAALAHIVGSMIIKPIGLFVFYGWAVIWRIPLYLVIAPVEIFMLCLVYKNGTFRRLIDEGELGK